MVKVTLERPWAWLVAAGMVASTLGVGTAWSYLRTAQHTVSESLRDAVPIAFELERVGQLTRELIPEIQASQKVAAQLEVEVEYLEREIKTMSDSQGEARSQMQKLCAALDQMGESHSGERHSFGDPLQRTANQVGVAVHELVSQSMCATGLAAFGQAVAALMSGTASTKMLKLSHTSVRPSVPQGHPAIRGKWLYKTADNADI